MYNLIPFLSYVFVTTFTPGPNNIMSMSNAKQFGFKKTFGFVLGVTVGFVEIMLICSYFNLLLFKFIPSIKLVMGIIGAAYMLYLAYIIVRNAPHSGRKSQTYTNTFFSGMILQYINPKLLLYGITVVSSFVIAYYKTDASLILFSLFFAFVGFLANLSWALFGALMQKFLNKYQRPFDIVMAALLVYCAASVSGLIH